MTLTRRQLIGLGYAIRERRGARPVALQWPATRSLQAARDATSPDPILRLVPPEKARRSAP